MDLSVFQLRSDLLSYSLEHLVPLSGTLSPLAGPFSISSPSLVNSPDHFICDSPPQKFLTQLLFNFFTAFHTSYIYSFKNLFWKFININKSKQYNEPKDSSFFKKLLPLLYCKLQWIDTISFFFTQGLAPSLAHDKHSTHFLFWMRRKVKDDSKNDGTTEKSETRRAEFWGQLVIYSSAYSLPGSGLSIGFQR